MKRTPLIVLLAVACFGLSHAQKKSTSPVTLFSVQDQPVYVEEFTYLYRKNHIKPEDFTQQKIEEYIILFVNFKLKVTEAKTRGLDTTAAFKKEFRTYIEELKRPFTDGKGQLEELIREVYQRQTEEINASHILISVRPDAQPVDTLVAYKKILACRERIMQGEDFEKEARKSSEDPSAKMNGGNLGYFTALQMVYPFEQVAYSLKPLEISAPVRTQFGYHLIKVNNRRPARGEVEVSHILLRTGTSDDAPIKNKIFEISDQLQGGRNWDELCKEYSDDPSTKNNGGRLKPFGTGALASVPEFEEVAFSLKEPHEISDPFKSAYGWHIIRLERKIPIPPYKDVEASLERKVSRNERMQMTNRKKLDEKKKKFHFTEDVSIKEQLFSLADTSLQHGSWRFHGSENLRTAALFTLGEKTETVSNFITFVEKEQQSNAQRPAAYIGQLYEKRIEEKISEVEEAQLMANDPGFRALVAEYKEGILLFTIMEQEVWNKASRDTLGQRQYYLANKGKYPAGHRVRARIYSATDKEFLDRILKKIIAGDSIRKEDARGFKSVLPLRNYEKGDNKAADKVSWAIGIHATEVDGTYYLVAIENLVPPGMKTLEEARPQVISGYQDDLEKKWVSDLKQKYAIKINTRGKKLVISELIKK